MTVLGWSEVIFSGYVSSMIVYSVYDFAVVCTCASCVHLMERREGERGGEGEGQGGERERWGVRERERGWRIV